MNLRILYSLVFLFISTAAVSQESGRDVAETTAPEKVLRRITVVGGQEGVATVPGAASYITGKELDDAKAGADDITKVLRRIPGVNIQEEDGFGLRPNIGLRGASSERSENITLMEDGVLVAPAPYSAPAAYYFPAIGRMEGIEVLKGAGQIKYGPRTTGGSLNLLSTSIPQGPHLNLTTKSGSNDSLFGHLSAGSSWTYGGFLLETYQAQSDGFKKIDGGGNAGFDLKDFLGKFRVNTNPKEDYYQELELKIGGYEQDAQETYLGLTKQDFNSNPYRRYAASHLDNIVVDHSQVQLRHYGDLGNGVSITNTLYSNKTQRNWYKLESIAGHSLTEVLDTPERYSDEYGWITGFTNSPDDTLALRNNRRHYGARGIQSVLGVDFSTGRVEHEAEAGVRYHYDYETRFQEEDKYRMRNGRLQMTSLGIPGTNANRKSQSTALALFLQDKMTFGKLSLTPGVRYEGINLLYSDYGKKDPSRLGTERKRNYSEVNVVIPGIGAHYQFTETLGSFVGIHKGFAPPGPSINDDVKEEKSVNYEVGANYAKGEFAAEATYFFNDYSNLLGADTAASGGSGTGDLFNAGAATVKGVEASLKYDLASTMKRPIKLPIYANYTYTDAQFDDSFNSTLFGAVHPGDPIPYVARNQFSAGARVEYKKVGCSLDMFHVDSMPTAATRAGLRGGPKTDSPTIFDLRTDYKVQDNTTLFFIVENLFDEEYVAALRPAGARPGRPQTFWLGFKVTL